MTLSNTLRIFEMGPRDGLQNESGVVSTEQKIQFINKLVAAGHTDLEVTSFVRPDRVPQLADSDALMAQIEKAPSGVNYWALTPNLKGYERALVAGIKHVAIFTSASNSFNLKNINTDIAGSLERFKPLMERAQTDGIEVRGYVSCCFGCPYEGEVSTEAVLQVSQQLFDMGCNLISIGDTIGVAVPDQVNALLPELSKGVPLEKIALHMHDTRGTALANVVAGYALGVRQFDASTGGLGGCPYAPGASGNLSTEDLLYWAQKSNIEVQINWEQQIEAAQYISKILDRPLTSRALLADKGA